MEIIKDHDKYLDPPDIPEYAECERCGEKFHADDLDEFGHCPSCADDIYEGADE